MSVEPGPEFLQAHPPTLTRRSGSACLAAAYAGSVIPGTGSAGWDVVLQIGIALVLLVSIVVLIKNYRGR